MTPAPELPPQADAAAPKSGFLSHRRLYRIVIILVLIMLIPALLFDDEVDAYFGGEEGLNRLRQFGGWAWLVGIGLIIADLIAPVPSTAVIAGLGMIYGPILGGLIGGIGSTLAGLVAFYGCRAIGPRVAQRLVGESDLGLLQRFFERHGLWAVALSRWMPLLPEALCCLAGLARMRSGPFIVALACGSFAMGFAFGALGQAYLERPAAGLLLSAAIPLAVWPPVHYFMRRKPADS
ncbi:TVP38/TMEM64 family protein [Tuwongella immobilis]|uniref:TVP38/TMEM64 family membrane protein n=1 Tax=Tuwongella immobilis TaxID=692036 RepID=A0A6C2YVS2_9BACT|nr:VTT domain-containing protein [Tuwongella immobilis]VIP05467.1 SNARE associated Golgi protein OS=Sphingomonas wittichii (strain RW1 / DSM 6014 / JCM 10273) GN=Swit_1435 PE=4 SV=1: SNARE_assoc [Tuwongella immobilis]VTS08290.1 SNARE associated Golgi protein OS=Sphingomonas wittichii (strain RW1 / DSM 6014 / JCM 10273) GN=Swit_1435 PE=4 SV=1: SNARE_assoc [Tuwongella immobilis]